jgi:hypothetical protein
MYARLDSGVPETEIYLGRRDVRTPPVQNFKITYVDDAQGRKS